MFDEKALAEDLHAAVEQAFVGSRYRMGPELVFFCIGIARMTAGVANALLKHMDETITRRLKQAQKEQRRGKADR